MMTSFASKTYAEKEGFAELTKTGVDLKNSAAVFELDEMGEGRNGDVQQILSELTGVRTVPQVFVSGKFIGGGDDMQRKNNSGELKRILQQAAIL
eukprot:g4760.t1